MKIFEFIYKDLANKPIEKFTYYDKQFYIFFATTEYLKDDDGQINRETKFYRQPLNATTNEKDLIFSYVIKTNLFKNYIALIDINDNEKDKLIKRTDNNYFCLIKTAIKGNKETIIKYQKEHENEYQQRDLNIFVSRLKDKQKEVILNNEKWRKANLKKYETLLKTLDGLKPREREIFTLKMINSKGDRLTEENLKFFLKWTRENDEPKIKRAIIYILNNDIEKGINYYIYDFDFIEQKNNKKWETKLYYRELYLKLFNKFLKETNGDEKRAKELTKQEIETKHTRPKN